MLESTHIDAIVLRTLGMTTSNRQTSGLARKRYEALAGKSIPSAVTPPRNSLSRRLCDARAMVESTPFDFDRLLGELDSIEADPMASSEAHFLKACAYIRLARLKEIGKEPPHTRVVSTTLPVAALNEIVASLDSDAANAQCLAALRLAEDLSGFEGLSDELRAGGR